jgi:hypothetical protein
MDYNPYRSPETRGQPRNEGRLAKILRSLVRLTLRVIGVVFLLLALYSGVVAIWLGDSTGYLFTFVVMSVGIVCLFVRRQIPA